MSLDDLVKREKQRAAEERAAGERASAQIDTATREFLARMSRLGNPGADHLADRVYGWTIYGNSGSSLSLSIEGAWGYVDRSSYHVTWEPMPPRASEAAGLVQGLAQLLARSEPD